MPSGVVAPGFERVSERLSRLVFAAELLKHLTAELLSFERRLYRNGFFGLSERLIELFRGKERRPELQAQLGEALDLPFYAPSRPLDKVAVQRAARLVRASKRPLLLVGQGTVLSGACQSVRRLAEDLKIPAVTTIMAKGALDELAKRMTPAQIAEAQKLAREWWAKFEAREKRGAK